MNSGGCTYNLCGGVRGGTKPRSTRYSGSGLVSCCRQACFSTAGARKFACRDVGQVAMRTPACRFPRWWKSCRGVCGYGDLPSPILSSLPLSPGPGREVRNGMGWSLMEKTARSGVWLFRGAFRGSSAFFAFAAFASWVEKGSFLTAWAVPPLFLRVLVSSYVVRAMAPLSRPQSGERCWPLLDRLWRAIAPLMKPWCAEGDVPTAANLNLYRGRSSHVGWHSDDEPLFGKRGEAKLIVSVSFGTQALFKWKGKSCPSNDGHSCWLGHGDILVMDGQCQDEFRHCTDPGSDQERINITFRWVKQHVASCSFLRTGVACCLPTCARGFSFSGTEIVEQGSFLSFWLLLGILCILGC